MRPNLESLESRNLCDIAPLAPSLPLVGPVGMVPNLNPSPPTLVIVSSPAPNTGLILTPADPVRMRLDIPVNLGAAALPLAPPVPPFPGGMSP